MKRLLATLISLTILLITGCASPPPRKGGTFRAVPKGMGIEGRVVSDGDLLENAYVYVYREVKDGFRTRPFRISEPTGSDGGYRLDLPPGRYYVLARKYQSGKKLGPLKPGDYYGYYGGNPIGIREPGFLWVGLNTVKEADIPPGVTWQEIPLDSAAGLRGVVYYNRRPVENAYVYLYLDESGNFKGEAFQVARTNKQGQFYFYTLPEGYYYVVARRRKSGQPAGPVQVGDLYAYYGGSPVFAALDEFTSLRIDCISKAAEIGRESLAFEVTTTKIEGRIVDKKGKPLSGLYAFVYLDKNMSHGRPPYLSKETQQDGRFILYLPAGGTYFLGARDAYGDAPGPGELYGRYEETPDHSIVLETNETKKNITLVVEPILGY